MAGLVRGIHCQLPTYVYLTSVSSVNSLNHSYKLLQLWKPEPEPLRAWA